MPEPEPNRRNYVLTAPPGGQFKKKQANSDAGRLKDVPVNMRNKINMLHYRFSSLLPN